MKLPIWVTMGLPCAVVAGGVALFACSDNKIQVPQGDGGTSASACAAMPGEFPQPNCASDSDPPSCPNAQSCPIDEAKCGSKSTCLPMASNTGNTTQNFRIRRLTVITPKNLAGVTIQTAVIDHGISLAAPACGEKSGDGSFTWLFQLDTKSNTVKTGGSPPTPPDSVFTNGYCFADMKVPSGQHVAPITAKVTPTSTANGTSYDSETIPQLIVPIFVANDPNQLILLPLSGVAVKGVTVSTDGNCIGTFNYAALDNQCADSRSDCSRWHTAGALAGYITLEDADTVPIPQLGNKSLCVLLTGGSADPMTNKCVRVNGKIKDPGDYCSTTKSAGGCQDSYWLAATFAASAVKIKDASSDPLCQGGSTGDGGIDAAGDAPTD